MFTDDSVRCDGPIVAGPSMWDWAQDLRAGLLPGEEVADLGPELAAELCALTAATFPSRRLQSAYLGWVLRHVLARPACRGPGARPRVPRDRADRRRAGPARPSRRWRDPARRRRRPRLRAPRRHPDRRRARPRRPGRRRGAALPAAGADHRQRPVGHRTGRAGDRAGHRAGVRRPGGAAVRGPGRALRARAGRRAALRALRPGAGAARRVAAGLALPREDRVRAARRPPDAAPVPRPGGRRPAGRARSTWTCVPRCGR